MKPRPRLARVLALFAVTAAAAWLPLRADTPIGGEVSANQVLGLSGSPYVVTTDLIVRNGALLTVDAGVAVRVGLGVNLIVESGAIQANGTAAARVVITSLNDVSGGSPQAGDWGQIRILDGSDDARTRLENVDLQYGQGVVLLGASPTIRSTSIRFMSGPAVDMDLASSPVGDGNSASNNGLNAIRVASGETTQPVRWGIKGIPYLVEGTVSIGRSPQITDISPVTFQQDDQVSATISGTRLDDARSVTFSGTGVTATIQPGGTSTSLPIIVTTTPAAALGSRTFTVDAAAGEVTSGGLPVQILPAHPVIDTLSPSFAIAGSSDTVVNVIGRKFASTAVVRVNDTDVPTTFRSSTRLDATFPASVLSTPGTLLVAAANPDPGTPGTFLVSPAVSFEVRRPSTITAITPNRGERSSVVDSVIGGTNLAGATGVTFSGTGAVATISPGGSDTSLPVRITIDPAAAVGARAFTVLTPAGNSESGSVTFTVTGITPNATSLLPTEAVAGGPGFSLTVNGNRFEADAEIVFNGVPISTTRVSASQLSGPVSAAAIASPSVLPVVIRQGDPLIPGQYLVSSALNFTVRTPEITLSPNPLQVIAGQSATLQLSIPNAAPAGGLVFDLVSSNPAVATVPATATVPVGGNSTSVLVTGVTTGSTTITASRTGYVSGSATAQVVPPPVLMPITPLQAQVVGVRVQETSTPSNLPVSPLTSQSVGVIRGSALYSIDPSSAIRGTQTLEITAHGVGLQGVTSVSVVPPAGLTIVGSPVVAPDGFSVRFTLSIDAQADPTWRNVLLRDANGVVQPASRYADRFRVTLPPAELISIDPIQVAPGSDFTLSIRGRYLQEASAVGLIQPQGITVIQPPAVSLDGTFATIRLIVASDAPLGPRVVTVTTPGGTSSPDPTAANTLNLVAQVGPPVTPLVSLIVGVRVQTPPDSTPPFPVQPLVSPVVGVIRGSAITGVVPAKASIGTSGLDVMIQGIGLSGATNVGFEPATGITINGTPVVAPDGTSVMVNISIGPGTDLVGWRVVRVNTSNGRVLPLSSWADRFRITLPEPALNWVNPIRGVVGMTVPLTVNGRNLTGATQVILEPVAGVTVQNPPVVNGDGTQLTVNVVIAANAPVGYRVVRVTTPGGTSTDVRDPTNSFEVSDQVGVQFSPFLAQTVGVRVQEPPTPAPTLSVQPLTAPGVGVLVPVTPEPTPPFAVSSLVAPGVGVVVGAAVTGVVPTAGAPGTASLDVVVHGIGLGDTQSVAVQPASGVTVNGSPVVAPDGTSATVNLSIDAAAPRGSRKILVRTTAGAVAQALVGFADTFYVGAPPAIVSLVPNVKAVGDVFTLTINGSALDGLVSVNFQPADGVRVEPATSITPTQITIPIVIAGSATPGARVVTVTTSYGTSTTEAKAANTFTIVGAALTSNLLNSTEATVERRSRTQRRLRKVHETDDCDSSVSGQSLPQTPDPIFPTPGPVPVPASSLGPSLSSWVTWNPNREIRPDKCLDLADEGSLAGKEACHRKARPIAARSDTIPRTSRARPPTTVSGDRTRFEFNG